MSKHTKLEYYYAEFIGVCRSWHLMHEVGKTRENLSLMNIKWYKHSNLKFKLSKLNAFALLSHLILWKLLTAAQRDHIENDGVKLKLFCWLLIKTFATVCFSALDPAFPGFMTPDTNIRLSSSDAKFVDVIHTDGGFFGFPYSIGHADFFPNGGIAVQPGCVQEEISKNRWLGILGELFSTCNSPFCFIKFNLLLCPFITRVE